MKKIFITITIIALFLPFASRAARQVSGSMPAVHPLQPAPSGTYIDYQHNSQTVTPESQTSSQSAQSSGQISPDAQNTQQPTTPKKPIDLTTGSDISGKIFLSLLAIIAGIILIYIMFIKPRKIYK